MEYLDELKLTSPLDLETLQLRKTTIVVEHGISLLQVLVLFFRRRQNHSLVGAVDFEKDGVIAVGFVLERLGIYQRLVLMVGELGMDQVIQHDARVGDCYLLPVLKLKRKVLREGRWQHAPNTVRIQL